MTEAASGYAILTEDDPNQNYISVKKFYAALAEGSKTITPSHLKMPIYAEEFLTKYYALQVFGRLFWGTPKPINNLTDTILVTRFFQTNNIPTPLWNSCGYVIEFKFITAHIPGKTNTAASICPE